MSFHDQWLITKIALTTAITDVYGLEYGKNGLATTRVNTYTHALFNRCIPSITSSKVMRTMITSSPLENSFKVMHTNCKLIQIVFMSLMRHDHNNCNFELQLCSHVITFLLSLICHLFCNIIYYN